MTIFFAGNELDVFNPLVASCRETTAVAAAFDSAFSRCAIQCGAINTNGPNTGFSTSNFPARSNIWLTWQEFQQSGLTVGTTTHFGIRNSAGVYLIQNISQSTGTARLWQVWNGVSAYTNIGVAYSFPSNSRVRFDLFVDFANQIFRLYIGGVLTIDTTLPASAAGFDCVNIVWNNLANSSSTKFVSEIIVADESTLALRVLTIPAVNNGALTQWAGTVTDINEIVLNDATAIVTSNISDLESFTINTPTIATNFAIKAVCIGARASGNGVSPDDLEGLLRIAGSNYFSAPVTLAGTTGGLIFAFNTNPANGSSWAINDLTAANIEFGFAARA